RWGLFAPRSPGVLPLGALAVIEKSGPALLSPALPRAGPAQQRGDAPRVPEGVDGGVGAFGEEDGKDFFRRHVQPRGGRVRPAAPRGCVRRARPAARPFIPPPVPPTEHSINP